MASVVATLTWQPASGPTKTSDPPPTSPVSILETASASEAPGCLERFRPRPLPAGTVDDGLGDAPTASSNGQGKISAGSHLTQQDGSSGVITLDKVVMSAACPKTTFSSTGTANWQQSISASVNLTVQLYSLTVSLSGQNSANQALTGQQITATLGEPTGLPTGTKITSYTWSFSGGTKSNPIKNWDFNAPGDGTPTQLVQFATTDSSQTDTTGNGISVSPISFYDQVADTVTTKCVVNLTSPDGTTKSVNAMSAAGPIHVADGFPGL